MPELPEVETIVRTLREKINGALITNSTLFTNTKSPILEQSLALTNLHGGTITSVERRAKLIKINIQPPNDAPQSIAMLTHLRMTGALLVQPLNNPPTKYSKIKFELAKGEEQFALFYDDIRGFGQIFIQYQDCLDKWNFWHNLGPEPLELSQEDFCKLLDKKSNRSIKTLLLDQKVIVGIGNIYADESLFKAGIHPARKVSSLTTTERSNLWQAIQDILKLSITQCGTSVRNYRDANGHAGAFQNSLAVYGKEGAKCPRCGTTLEKLHLGGRSAVICPACQQL